MAITFIERGTSGGRIIDSDVSITMVKAGETTQLSISLKSSTVNVRLNGANFIAIGWDADTNRLYIIPGDERNSYKLSESKKSGDRRRLTVRTSKFEGIVESPSMLCGEYNLKFDADERAYYVDYNDVVRFQSRKIRTI